MTTIGKFNHREMNRFNKTFQNQICLGMYGEMELAKLDKCKADPVVSYLVVVFNWKIGDKTGLILHEGNEGDCLHAPPPQ